MSEFNIVNESMNEVGIELLGQLKREIRIGQCINKIRSSRFDLLNVRFWTTGRSL